MIALRARRTLVAGSEREGCYVTIEGGRIAAVGDDPLPAARIIDLGACDLVPGFVDLHSDCLERFVLPRPTMEFPTAAALLEYDATVVAHGITTNYLCISLEGAGTRFRTPARARAIGDALLRHRTSVRADHAIHIRVDVTDDTALTMVPELLDRGLNVRMISYMDHTPGQGQYGDEQVWAQNYARGQSSEQIAERLAVLREGHRRSNERRERLAEIARTTGIVLASHDDDGRAAVDRAVALGVRVCEFPVSAEAARLAHAAGLGTVMGAPNAFVGLSHVNNLSARDAIAAGTLDAIASDYHPPALVAAAYRMVEDGACSWPQAIDLIAGGPARIAGLRDRGAIAPGLRADLVAIDRIDGHPIVRQTWVAGVPALGLAA